MALWHKVSVEVQLISATPACVEGWESPQLRSGAKGCSDHPTAGKVLESVFFQRSDGHADTKYVSAPGNEEMAKFPFGMPFSYDGKTYVLIDNTVTWLTGNIEDDYRSPAPLEQEFLRRHTNGSKIECKVGARLHGFAD